MAGISLKVAAFGFHNDHKTVPESGTCVMKIFEHLINLVQYFDFDVVSRTVGIFC